MATSTSCGLLRHDYIDGAGRIHSGERVPLLWVDLYEPPAGAEWSVDAYEDALLWLWFCPSRQGWRQAWQAARRARRYWRLAGVDGGVLAAWIEGCGAYPLVTPRQYLIRYEWEI